MLSANAQQLCVRAAFLNRTLHLITKFDMGKNVTTNTYPQHDAKLPVSGWRWFDAVIKFKDGNICNYASTTNGSIEDAKKQATNVVIGQTAEILSIAFR